MRLTPMKLYSSPTSPYVRKVRVAAAELGLSLELETVKVHEIPSDYGNVNPVNRIPALRLDDGSMVFDSRVICEYLDAQKGAGLLPPSGSARWYVLKLQVFGDGILDAAVPRRMEMNRPAAQQSPPRLTEYERSIHQTLDALEGMTAELTGLNLGTIAIGCALGYLDFRFADENWRASRPNLARWFEAFAKRPSMQATQPG
jgi:glutathione S-transferase